MTWLLPTAVIAFKGTVRTVGEASARERKRAANRRWAMSPSGRAYFRRIARDPRTKAARAAKYKRWLNSEKGRAWLARVRERRNAYYRLRYQTDGGRRRAYLTMKQREYRAARRSV